MEKSNTPIDFLLYEMDGIKSICNTTDYLIFNGDLMAKPRMTQKDKWCKRVSTTKYWSFKDKLILEANKCNFILSEAFEFFAFIEMPKSWSAKKKKNMFLSKHQNKPDTDNVMKSINDIFGKTDEKRWSNTGHKFWYTESLLFIRNKSIKEIEIIEKQAQIITNLFKHLKTVE